MNLGTIAVLLTLLLPFTAAAQQEKGDIQNVIRNQIQSFEQGDLEGAFGFASPNIRTMFKTPERFGQMVEQGYPMVWRPSSVRFGSISSQAGRNFQIVILRDGNGQYHALEYEMIRMDGGWKIDGVRFVDMPDVGA